MSFENSGVQEERTSSVEVTLVDDVKAELNEIDASDLS